MRQKSYYRQRAGRGVRPKRHGLCDGSFGKIPTGERQSFARSVTVAFGQRRSFSGTSCRTSGASVVVDRADTPKTTPTGDRTRSAAPILIVEDDADLRDMMAQFLLVEGFNPKLVSNGREALEYLRNGETPAVILLDLMMPVMDGWEFRRRQQRDPKAAKVPVIVLSALDRTRVGDIGEAPFMKKPLDFDRLLDLVRRYCK
jgi:CheY-like chemotaxis protein